MSELAVEYIINELDDAKKIIDEQQDTIDAQLKALRLEHEKRFAMREQLEFITGMIKLKEYPNEGGKGEPYYTMEENLWLKYDPNKFEVLKLIMEEYGHGSARD